ncbi:MAG: Gfo/Idh/MocA family oxidoreductase [Pseudomonadota bacterium]
MTPVAIGIIGCGNISDSYFKGAATSKLVTVKACADLKHELAVEKAETYGSTAVSVDDLLADKDISIVINLTVPLAHAQVSRQILEAGKHVYTEKPLAAEFKDAKAVLELADRKGLRVGSAPDTFMGAAHQAARRAIDDGKIGRVVAGAAAVISHGMEHWHPNPSFFYKPGGGPILDIGPYYITQLVNLLGPVARVTAVATRGLSTRTVTSEPLAGSTIDVEIATNVNGILDFVSGANVTLTATWDVWKHEKLPFEIYGTEGSLLVPDPNFFGGEVEISAQDSDWQSLDISAFPFGVPNRANNDAMVADYRMIGLFDMAAAIDSGRPHRASGALALHVLEVMEGLQTSSDTGQHVAMQTRPDRPEPVPLGAGEEVFLQANSEAA